MAVDGAMSGIVAVISGAPQGSVLEPALFNLFINDMVDSVSPCTIHLFANDTLMYTLFSDDRNLTKLQLDLGNLYEWSLFNGMKLDASK